MARPSKTIFLERQSYRRRRLADAAKLLPLIGFVLILMPILWADEARTSGGIIYLFSVWAILFVSRGLSGTEPEHFEPPVYPDEDV